LIPTGWTKKSGLFRRYMRTLWSNSILWTNACLKIYEPIFVLDHVPLPSKMISIDRMYVCWIQWLTPIPHTPPQNGLSTRNEIPLNMLNESWGPLDLVIAACRSWKTTLLTHKSHVALHVYKSPAVEINNLLQAVVFLWYSPIILCLVGLNDVTSSWVRGYLIVNITTGCVHIGWHSLSDYRPSVKALEVFTVTSSTGSPQAKMWVSTELGISDSEPHDINN
jgi:hypothetical protein